MSEIWVEDFEKRRRPNPSVSKNELMLALKVLKEESKVKEGES